MELIKRYIYAVQRRLPFKTREDMGKEIESLILDELEDQFELKEKYSDIEITEVLKKLGPPYKTAARYNEAESYLIGPNLFEIYRLILIIAAGAVTFGLLISHIIGMFHIENTFPSMAKDFLLFFPSLITALLAMVGAVTIVFYLFQRFGTKKAKELEKEFECEWNPKDLPDLPRKEEVVKIWEPIVGIFFTILALVILNTLIFTDPINHPAFLTGKVLRIFNVFNIESLRHFAPLWNISLIGGLALSALLIPIGRRDRRINLIDMIINLFDITVMVVLIRGPLLINISGIRSSFTVNVGSFLEKFLLNSDIYLDRLFIVLIVLTAISFTVKAVKVIIGNKEK